MKGEPMTDNTYPRLDAPGDPAVAAVLAALREAAQ